MKRSLRWIGLAVLAGAFVVVTGCNLFNAAPEADFDWSPNEPLARTEVEFEDTSTDEGGLFGSGGVISWDWDFDDGESASSRNPTHEFDKSGDYDVTLTVTDAGGKSATVEKTVPITASVAGTWRGYIVDNTGFANDMELVITQSSTGGIQGTCYMLGATLACSDTSFDPETKRVRFSLFDLGIRLDGTMDASETRIEGDWWILGAPVNMWSWDVTLD
ncbi:MAG: PKD domain-containing protein [Thermotogota bacterium]